MLGFGLQNLSRGKDLILEALGEQVSRDSTAGKATCCVQCGACMTGPSLYTADAGQAYEMVKPEKIERAFNSVFDSIRPGCKHPDPTITVLHCTKSKTKYGGWVSEQYMIETCFPFAKLVIA